MNSEHTRRWITALVVAAGLFVGVLFSWKRHEPPSSIISIRVKDSFPRRTDDDRSNKSPLLR